MKGFPKLTHKGILKRHKNNPQDQSLHKAIETNEIKKTSFDELIEKGVKQKPFDKKKQK
ncbi:hypothetical protein HYW54_04785 [Candidatus Gottesmanbacteria bacterium]|nr:hypothetical protein [Candidatus Gottesmanbacteria bacterium]MBI4078999.1 hypothetical protein [Candidatus Levybacteria bacterium]